MNSIKNSVVLIGNVGSNPEFKQLDKGSPLVRLSLATNESYTNKSGEKVEQTQWHNIIAWGKLAEVMNTYLIKGTKIAIRGKLNYRTYDDKAGNTKYITEIVADEMEMLAKPQSKGQS